MPRRRDAPLRWLSRWPNSKTEATRGLLAAVAPRQLDTVAITRANAEFVWSYYVRLAQLAWRGGRRRQLRSVTAVGEQHLVAALSHERGVILASVHLGDFDLGGAWLVSQHDVTPVVVARPLPEKIREALFSGVRRRCGVIVRDMATASLDELIGDLDRCRAILVMLDRRPPGATLPNRLLGRPAVAPAGIAWLAAQTGAPILPVAMWRSAEGRPIAWFGAPVTCDDMAEATAALTAATAALGEHIRGHPEHWHIPAAIDQLAWETDAAMTPDPDVTRSARHAPAARR